MVKVDKKEVEFIEGMTIADALELAEERLDQMSIVMVDGKVIPNEHLDTTLITNNTKVSLLRLISGG